MKRYSKPKSKVVKGTSSAVLLSIAIHAGLFFLAGALVIFKVLNPPEVEFKAPPQVKVPRMPLKKLMPKLKKPSKPKSSAKITAIVEKVNINDIQFPDLATSGVGTGFSEGGGDWVSFGDMPSFDDDVSIFGENQPTGNDLEGTFYDLKRRRGGGRIVLSRDEFLTAAGRFVRSDWNPSALARYYRAPQKLYATTIMVPPILSVLAPSAFNEPEVEGLNWLVHYKGKLVHPEPIRFRFWGSADDVLVVRVDEKIVLNACWPGTEHYFSDWNHAPAGNRTYSMGNQTAVIGRWIILEPGKALDMEVLIGEQPGGIFNAMLCVEVEGVRYEKNEFGGPVLPMFKMAEPSLDLMDAIYYNLYPDEASVTNGPIFRDY